MYLDKMNYLEVERYLKSGDTAILVTGSTENHGKHMPLGTDTFIPQKIMELVENRCSDLAVVMPALPYGSTEDLKGFAGTLSTGPYFLTELLNHLFDQMFDYGFRHFIVVNGHGGNSKPIECTAHHLYDKGALLARVDWWLIAGQINPAWKGGHGGGEETAGVMAVDESLIKKDYIYEKENLKNDISPMLPTTGWNTVDFEGGQIVIPRPINKITDNGWFAYGMPDAPSRADADWGKEMLEGMADYIAKFIPVFSDVELPPNG